MSSKQQNNGQTAIFLFKNIIMLISKGKVMNQNILLKIKNKLLVQLKL